MRTVLVAVLILAACVNPNPFVSPLAPSEYGLIAPSEYGLTVPQVRETYLPVILTVSCLWSGEALLAGGELTTDSRQERTVMKCHPALANAAQARAANLAANNYFAHCDPTGKCANQYARDAGCILPDYYSENGNNIESLVAGPADWSVAYWFLSNSPAHANHLFGKIDFFREQMHYGVGVVHDASSLYKHYYVYLIAICK